MTKKSLAPRIVGQEDPWCAGEKFPTGKALRMMQEATSNMTPADAEGTSGRADLLRDQSGAMLIIGVLMCGVACGFLWYIIGVGNAMLYRESLQDSADSLAFSGAVWHAKGMHVIVAMNLLMTALMAVLVILRALETVLFGIEIICAVLAKIPYTAAFGEPCKIFAKTTGELVESAADKLDQRVYAKLLPLMNKTTRGLSIAFPYIAEAKVVQLARKFKDKNAYNGGVQGGEGLIVMDGLIPRKDPGGFMYGLPIEEDTKGYTGRTQKFMGDIMQDYLGGFSKVAGGILAKGTDTLGWEAHKYRGRCVCYKNQCGNSPKFEEPKEFDISEGGLFDKPIKEACEGKSKPCQSKGDSFEYTYREVNKTTGKEVGEEKTESGHKNTLEHCSAVAKDPPYDHRCDSFGARNAQVPDTCPKTKDGKPNDQYKGEAYRPNDSAGIYWCWDNPGRCDRADENGIPYERDDKIYDDRGLRIEKVREWTYDQGACEKAEHQKVKEELNKKKAEKKKKSGASKSGSSGCSKICESPKKLFCGLKHAGEDTFQIRSVVRGKELPLHARQGVGVAAPGKEDSDLPMRHEVYRFGFAQAEYYYSENNWNELSLWNFKWQARLRRFHINDKAAELLKAVEIVQLGDNLDVLQKAGIELLQVMADCYVDCRISDEPVNSKCYGECVSSNAQLPINRYQVIH